MFRSQCPICDQELVFSVIKYDTRNGTTYTLKGGCATDKIEFQKNFNTAEDLADGAEQSIYTFTKEILAIKNRKQFLIEQEEAERRQKEELERRRELIRIQEEEAKKRKKALAKTLAKAEKDEAEILIREAGQILAKNSQIFEKQYEIQLNTGERLIFELDSIEPRLCQHNRGYIDGVCSSWERYNGYIAQIAIKLKCLTRPIFDQRLRQAIYFQITSEVLSSNTDMFAKIEFLIERFLKRATDVLNLRLEANGEVEAMGAQRCAVCHEIPAIKTRSIRDPRLVGTYLKCACRKETKYRRYEVFVDDSITAYELCRENDKELAEIRAARLVPLSLQEWNLIANMTKEEYDEYKKERKQA